MVDNGDETRPRSGLSSAEGMGMTDLSVQAIAGAGIVLRAILSCHDANWIGHVDLNGFVFMVGLT